MNCACAFDHFGRPDTLTVVIAAVAIIVCLGIVVWASYLDNRDMKRYHPELYERLAKQRRGDYGGGGDGGFGGGCC